MQSLRQATTTAITILRHYKQAVTPLPLLFFILLSSVFLSCKKEKPPVPPPPPPSFYLRATPTSLQLSGNASQQVAVGVEANSEWSVAVPQGADWIVLDKTSSANNDSIKIKTRSDNVTGVKRTATITISLNNGKATPVQVVVEQAPLVREAVNIVWSKMLGGNGNEYPYALVKTTDGGHLLATTTGSSNNGDVPVSKGGYDVLLFKLDANGTVTWKKTYGGSGNEEPAALTNTPDGGYAFAAYTSSNNTGDVGPNKGGLDFWVVKIDANGNIKWQKTLGGSADERPFAITATTENKLVVTGSTKSNNTGDVGINHGQEDFWVLMLDENNGNAIWKKTAGGNGNDIAKAVALAADGGVVIGGYTNSNNNGDVPVTKGGSDFWVIKMAKDGTIQWQKTWGGNGAEELNALAVAADNTLVAVGSSTSSNGDVTGGKGSSDFWVVQINAGTGTMNWQKTLGGALGDVPRSVLIAENGKIVVAGYTYTNSNGDVGVGAGSGDFWVVALSNTGSVIWKKLLGGSDEEQAFAIVGAEAGSYVVTGYTHSNNSGDVQVNHGASDAWVVKLKE